MDDSAPIVGKCLEMCPEAEVIMRTKNELLDRFEIGLNFHPVKEYTRSAAGQTEEDEYSIRPPDILQATLTYLFNQVVTSDTSLKSYNFVSDRLQAIKRDLFKQQCHASKALPILEPMVRYLAWASFYYYEEKFFEKHLHDNFLLQCLTECLIISDRDKYPVSEDISALFILYNLGESYGIMRFLEKSNRSPAVHHSLYLSIHWFHRNYAAVCKNIKKLPALLAAIVTAKHLGVIQRHGLLVMSTAYRRLTANGGMVTPWRALMANHLFNNVAEAKGACEFYKLDYTDQGVIFGKNPDFNNPQIYLRRPKWIQEVLEEVCLPSLFLGE